MINEYLYLIKKHKQTFVVFAGLVSLSLLFVFLNQQSRSKEEETVVLQLADQIPSDFVMVPVELENHEAISDLISSHGVVDLYKELSDASIHRLAQAVRIIRSQTDRFSVLIPEDQVSPFVKEQEVFHAVVQSPDKKDSQIHPIPLKKKRTIVFESEE